MDKICLINQPAGFGDIFLVQKIVSVYIKKGYKVIYPLINETLIVKDYIKTDNLEFVNINDNFPYKNYYGQTNIVETDNFIYLPLNGASRLKQNYISVLEVKYDILNIDYSDWSDYFNFERNYEKENELYYNILKLKDGEEYEFINNSYGTQPNSTFKNVPTNKNIRQVNMNFIEGYSLFDWCKVIENASEISIVDTSLNYIIEKLDLKTDKLKLTSRFTPPNWIDIKNLFKKRWILQDK